MSTRLRTLIRRCEYWESIGLPLRILDNSNSRPAAEELLLDISYFPSLRDLFNKTTRKGATFSTIVNSPDFLVIEEKGPYIENLLDKVKMEEEPLQPRHLRTTLELLLAGAREPQPQAKPIADTKRNRRCVIRVDQVLAEFHVILDAGISRNHPLLVQFFEKNPKMFLSRLSRTERKTVLSICTELNGRDTERAYSIVGLRMHLRPGTVGKIYKELRALVQGREGPPQDGAVNCQV